MSNAEELIKMQCELNKANDRIKLLEQSVDALMKSVSGLQNLMLDNPSSEEKAS